MNKNPEQRLTKIPCKGPYDSEESASAANDDNQVAISYNDKGFPISMICPFLIQGMCDNYWKPGVKSNTEFKKHKCTVKPQVKKTR